MIGWGHKCYVLISCGGIALAASTASGQPTYSLEVAALNGMPVFPRLTSIEVEPGSIVTVEVFLRNWSVGGVPLKAYQFAFDATGYTSGFSGNVNPKDFATTTQMPSPCTSMDSAGPENTANAFIDESRGDFVHAGLNPYLAVGTRRCGYRYGGAVQTAGPVSIPGVKKYLGTLILQASPDASGAFTVRLDRNTDQRTFLRSGFAGNEPVPIEPISFEDLRITVVPEVDLNILSAEPPDDAVDARMPTALNGSSPRGFTSVELHFNKLAAGLMPSDFQLTADPPRTVPGITGVMTNGNSAVLQFDAPIPVASWTTITHVDSTPTSTRLGFQPADVNNDGRSLTGDVSILIQGLNNIIVLEEWQRDIDSSNGFNPQDLIAQVNLLNGANMLDGWLGRRLPGT